MTMSVGGRPEERLSPELAAYVRTAVKSTLTDLNENRPAKERITHRVVASATTAAYPVERDEQWLRNALRKGQPLTPATAREMIVRIAAAGARIPRSKLVRFENAFKPERRPYAVIPPGQGRRLAALIVATLIERRLVQPIKSAKIERAIADTIEPFEAIFSTSLGRDMLSRIRSECFFEEMFDGRTMAVRGLAVRRSTQSEALLQMKTPMKRARKSV